MSLGLPQIPHRLALTLLGHDRVLSNTLKAIILQIRCYIVSGTPNAVKTSGVQHGSVLGPLLFLVYVNDIWKNIDSSIRPFADDCIMYRQITNKKDIVKLPKELERGVSGGKWDENKTR